ncbi:MAG: hypothetical protein U0136_02935 [Bdellovibrionota bacterium]
MPPQAPVQAAPAGDGPQTSKVSLPARTGPLSGPIPSSLDFRPDLSGRPDVVALQESSCLVNVVREVYGATRHPSNTAALQGLPTTPEGIAAAINARPLSDKRPLQLPDSIQLAPDLKVPVGDPRAIAAISREYLHLRTVQSTVEQMTIPVAQQPQVVVGAPIRDEQALAARLRKSDAGLVIVALNPSDGALPQLALLGIDRDNRYVMWGPTLGGKVTPISMSGPDGKLAITCSVPGPSGRMEQRVFNSVNEISRAGERAGPPDALPAELQRARPWQELRGVLPNIGSICFGMSHTIETLSEGREQKGQTESAEKLAHRLVAEGARESSFEYPEKVLLSDGTTVPTRSPRGLLEVASRVQQRISEQGVSQLPLSAGLGPVRSAADLFSKLQADRDGMMHLVVKLEGVNGGIHSILLQRTDRGFVVFDPNHTGPQQAKVVQTTEFTGPDRPGVLGPLMLRYSPKPGEDVTATVLGAARAAAHTPAPPAAPVEAAPLAPPAPAPAPPAPSVELPPVGV